MGIEIKITLNSCSGLVNVECRFRFCTEFYLESDKDAQNVIFLQDYYLSCHTKFHKCIEKDWISPKIRTHAKANEQYQKGQDETEKFVRQF